jgi:hypothetical protein
MSPIRSHSPPFFVVGAQRSGTTMFRLMLNQHSSLCVPFESRFIPALARRAAEFGDLTQPAPMERLLAEIAAEPFVVKGRLLPDLEAVLARRPTDYAALVDAVFMVLAERKGKARWGDKTPSYVLDMECLWSLFPSCRFIHLIRDGRDVALSMRTLSWGSRDLLRVARDWQWKVSMGRKMGRMVAANYLEVFYEDLVVNTEHTLRRVCDFLGETYEPEMLDFDRTAVGEMPRESLAWHAQSVKRPDPDKVGQWRKRMSTVDQNVFERAAGDALDEFGYARAGIAASFASRIRFLQYAVRGQA